MHHIAPPLAAYGASILASSALDLRPQCSSGVDTHDSRPLCTGQPYSRPGSAVRALTDNRAFVNCVLGRPARLVFIG